LTQSLEPESFAVGRSFTTWECPAPPQSDSNSRSCANLASRTAVSRIMQASCSFANSTGSQGDDLSIRDALLSFRNHVDGIVNPFLADLLLDRLDVVRGRKIDFSRGIERLFEGVILPNETLKVIHTASLFFAKISTRDQERVQGDLAALANGIRDNHAHQMARKVHAELEILLKAHSVLALDPQDAKSLLEHVREDSPDLFKAWIYSLIKNGKLDEKALETYSQEVYHNSFATLVKQTIKKKPHGIPTSLCSPSEEHSSRIQEQRLLQIQTALAEIEQYILLDDILFKTLVTDLVSGRFKRIRCEILTTKHLAIADKIREVAHAKYILFDKSVTEDEVLIEVIGAVAFKRLIPGQRCLLIENTMELLNLDPAVRDCVKLPSPTAGFRLNNGVPSVELLSENEGVFFFGNTDAGKSTSINYFLGAKMKKVKNKVGDPCFIIEEEEAHFPKIGQAIGTSETLFARAYPLKSNEKRVLIDCPGFNDTRGEHYRLCTHLSIDLAARQIGKIKAVVIVLPIAEFIQDRGNHIVKIFEAIKARFYGLLDAGQIDRFPFVHILLTKISHVSSFVAQSVRDGKVFSENLSEIREEIGKHINCAEGNMRLAQLQEALAIWKALQELHLTNRIRMIDLEDEVEKEELLVQYFKTDEDLPKQCYRSVIENPTAWQEFGDTIMSITKNWLDVILRPYVEGIPAEISRLLQESAPESVIKDLHEKRCYLAVALKMQARSLLDLKNFIQLLLKSGKISQQGQPNNGAAVSLFQQFLEMHQRLEQHPLVLTHLMTLHFKQFWKAYQVFEQKPSKWESLV